MHTLMVVSGGLALLAVFCAVGWGASTWRGIRKAALWFLPAWLVASIVNLTVGVVTAGYTVAQELPVLIPVFGIPALAAFGLAKWAARKAG